MSSELFVNAHERTIMGLTIHYQPLKMRTWALTSYVGRQMNWKRVAKMDRKTAAQVVNEAIIAGGRRLADVGNAEWLSRKRASLS